jgi:hypothetical protein
MKFSEAIAILELTEDMDEVTGLVTAYRVAVKKYHPDVSLLPKDDALKITKLVNEAYSFLIDHRGKWHVGMKSEGNLAADMEAAIAKVYRLPSIILDRIGTYLWIEILAPVEFAFTKGETFDERWAKKKAIKAFRKGIADQLKVHDFRWNSDKQRWMWGPRTRSNGYNFDDLKMKYGHDNIQTRPAMALG